MKPMQVSIGLILFVMVASSIGIIKETFATENTAQKAAALIPPTAGEAEPTGTLTKALETYDRAFQARDLPALKQILADDVAMFEQGTQNIGRDDVLKNHLGPELRAFQELTAKYSDVRVQEGRNIALVTRQFAIRARNQKGQWLQVRGVETQGWSLKANRWELAHIHLSFSPR